MLKQYSYYFTIFFFEPNFDNVVYSAKYLWWQLFSSKWCIVLSIHGDYMNNCAVHACKIEFEVHYEHWELLKTSPPF